MRGRDDVLTWKWPPTFAAGNKNTCLVTKGATGLWKFALKYYLFFAMLKGGGYKVDLGVDGRTILKWILGKIGRRV